VESNTHAKKKSYKSEKEIKHVPYMSNLLFSVCGASKRKEEKNGAGETDFMLILWAPAVFARRSWFRSGFV
jgi:hypothetical protein